MGTCDSLARNSGSYERAEFPMNETLLMSAGATMFGLTVWAVLLTAYASGRDASKKDLAFGAREPMSFPEGGLKVQPAYIQADRALSVQRDTAASEE